MTDDMIKKLGEKDGVISVNFYTAFVDSATANYQARSFKEIGKIMQEKKLKFFDPEVEKLMTQYKKDHPAPEVDIEVIANHIDHIVKLAGIDHVAFGSDFDGVGGMLPKGLEDPSKYPNLIYRLLKRGYTESDIEKICYKNLFRVWNKVEEVAKVSN